jgi:hypothetical protein
MLEEREGPMFHLTLEGGCYLIGERPTRWFAATEAVRGLDHEARPFGDRPKPTHLGTFHPA